MSVESATAALRAAYHQGVPCPPLRDQHLPAGDLAQAYRVQRALAAEWFSAGRRRVGAKVGLTSEAVQHQLGVDQPDFGLLLADLAVPDGAEVPAGRLLQPKVEAEVAFVLGAGLPEPEVTTVDVIRAVEFMLPAIEIADCRIADWDITVVDTVADNAAAGLFVLGTQPRRLSEVDLRSCGMVLEQAGEPVSVGAGAACLGNPLHAVAWLAGTLAAAGDPLQAGDVVLSGALGPMVTVTPGATYQARISGLGSVRVRFADESGGAG